MGSNGWLRWRYVVDWKLQGQLCLHGLVYGAILLVMMSVGIFMPVVVGLGSPGPGDSLANEQLAIVMLYLHERFWWIALLCSALVVVGAIRFSHRIAGPLVRYKRNLRLLADGRLPPPLRTRRRDHLKEEVACLNAAVAGVATRVAAIAEAHEGLMQQLHGLATSATPAQRAWFTAVLQAGAAVEARLRAFSKVDPGDERAPAAQPVGAKARLATEGA
jgi:hypothetical protein